VVYAEEFHLEGAYANRVAGLKCAQLSSAQQTVLLQPAADQPTGEGCSVDGRLKLLQQVGQRASVVHVSVSEDDAANHVKLVAQVVEIGEDQINAQHVILGEHDSHVDDQYVAAIFQHHHVLSYLPQAA